MCPLGISQVNIFRAEVKLFSYPTYFKLSEDILRVIWVVVAVILRVDLKRRNLVIISTQFNAVSGDMIGQAKRRLVH